MSLTEREAHERVAIRVMIGIADRRLKKIYAYLERRKQRNKIAG